MDDDFEDLYQDYTNGREATDSDDETVLYKNQIEDVTQLSNQYGSLGDVFKTSEKQSRDKSGRHRPSDRKFADVALLLRRTYHWDLNKGESWSMTLEIQSPVLRKAFKDIVQGFTSSSLEQNPIVIQEPFSELYFCRERIRAAIENAESDEIKVELELLEQFRKTYMKQTIESLEISLSEGYIEAADLWSLFPMGSKIILQNRDVAGKPLIWCMNVRGCFEEPADRQDFLKVWIIHVEFTSFNGTQFLPVERTFRIGGYKGPRAVRSLPAYPLDLHPQKEELQKELIARGKQYVDLCTQNTTATTERGKGTHCSYSGPFWIYSQNVEFHRKPNRQVSSRTLKAIYAYLM